MIQEMDALLKYRNIKEYDKKKIVHNEVQLFITIKLQRSGICMIIKHECYQKISSNKFNSSKTIKEELTCRTHPTVHAGVG